jgi:hypothetical protein
MIINKITDGFVIQKFDTQKKEFITQEFIAADNVSWENERGETVDAPRQEDAEPYLNFDMMQPDVKESCGCNQGNKCCRNKRKTGEHYFTSFGEIWRCKTCGRDEDDAFVGGEECSFVAKK